MKTILTLSLLLLTVTTTIAQKTIKKYNFTYIQSDYKGSCQGMDVVYFSPIVNYNFESRDGILVDPRDEKLQESKLADKWKSKCINYYQFDKDYCMVPKAWVWSKDFDEVDEKRDAMIKDFKNRGFKVYVSHNFSFNL